MQSLPDIKGFIKNTLIEWDGMISSEVFLPGCNFRCPYCHSYELFTKPDEIDAVSWDDVCKYLDEKKGWVDGLVLCGGEPLMSRGILNCLEMLKNRGIKVKIDTNGYFPEELQKAIARQLVAYIAMDIKAPLNALEYSRVTGVNNVDILKLVESINLIKKSGIDYEFRTTMCPVYINKKNVVEIAKSIEGAKKYSLQQFNPKNCYSTSLRGIKPYLKEEIYEMKKLVAPYVESCMVKGV
ncbi:MAG: anaerobic ribonucleoside-triphosphate reductase activating protein [Candidatus Aureabacteria bacterium]|nr:anaerobic ribonucleoside-triphosphate reductase activating protein [Candidatus Auribacterota bacterium]